MERTGPVAFLLRHLDLVVLAAALPVFIAAELPMLGYGILAGVWIAQHVVLIAAERHARARLAAQDRKGAMGWVAATTLGRVWVVAISVLVTGLVEREAGLAAAVLAAILMTVSLATRAASRALENEGAQG